MSFLTGIFLMINLLQPGGTSIQGYVSDESGDPLAGATVTVLEINEYAITDDEGWYCITLPSGMYAIEAEGEGMRVTYRYDVVAMEGEPTRLDMHLSPLGSAEPVPIQSPDDNSSSGACRIGMPLAISISDDAIQPLGRDAGVVDVGVRNGSIKYLYSSNSFGYAHFSTLDAPVDDHLHVRGGRRAETLLLVDGRNVREPIDGAVLQTIPLSSINSMEFSPADFDCRYGNFMSGVAEYASFEGSTFYSGDFHIEGNDWHSLRLAEEGRWGGITAEYPGEYGNQWKYSEVSPFNEAYLSIGGSIGGPEPISSYLFPDMPGNVRIFLDGEYSETGGGEEGRYGYGFDEWETSYRGLIKLTYDPARSTSIDLTTSFLDRTAGWFRVGDYWKWSKYAYPIVDLDPTSSTYGDTLAYGNNIHYGLPRRSWDCGEYSIRISHEFQGGVLMEGNFTLQDYDYHHRIRNDPESTDPMRQTEWLGENWSWSDWESYLPNQTEDYDGFIRSGTSSFPWNETTSRTGSIQLNTIASIWNDHELNWGVQASFYDVYRYTVMVDTTATGSNGEVHQNRFDAEPYSGGIYLQDGITLEDGMHLTGGVRLDYFDAARDGFVEPYIIPPPDDDFQYWVLDRIEASPKYAINPRLSFRIPINENQSISAGYGRFSQMPLFRYLYHSEDFSFSEDLPLGGNPDLELQNTTLYQLGTHYDTNAGIEIDLTLFIKEMSDMVETGTFTHSRVGDYALFTSTGTAESRGLEVRFSGEDVGLFSWDASYTLSKATGTSSHPLQNYLYAVAGDQNMDTDQYLDWDQTHTLQTTVSMQVPRNRGMTVAGSRVLQGLEVTLGWEYGSGFPYTYRSYYNPGPLVDVNTCRYPSTNEAVLRINKRFWFDSFTMDAWCEITNLFDNHDVVDIQDVNWYMAEMYGGDPDEDDRDAYGPLDNPYAMSQTRMFRFGLGVNW